MNLAADTSVVVPALLEEHADHERAGHGMARTDCTIWHVMFESYSVLTRLPGDLRVTPSAAAQAIATGLPGTVLAPETLDAGVLELLSLSDVSAGSTYDGLIAVTARDHGVRLLSRDRRAARTYAALGVPHELL